MTRKLTYKDGIVSAFPIFIGYIPISITFGLLAKSISLTMLDAFLFSVIVFAGASQFVALNLIKMGIGMGEIVLATLLMNFRHFLMSASLAVRLSRKRWIPIVSFGITDETFSVASTQDDQITSEYLVGLNGTAYVGWVGGTILGYGVGQFLPEIMQKGMGIALYAMFIALLIPEAKKSKNIARVAAISAVVNMLLTYTQWINAGWGIIISIIIGAGMGSICENKEENKEAEVV